MKRMESIKRLVVLQLTGFGQLVMIAAYGVMWFMYYKQKVNVSFYIKGDILVIAVYAILLMFFNSTYGGTKIGYLKAMDVFLSEVFSIVATNVISYAQLALMSAKLAHWKPMILFTLCEIVFSLVWVFLSDAIYRTVFPPRDLLLIYGERPYDDIVRKFNTRKDRYNVADKIDIKEGYDKVEEKISQRFDGIILWDIPTVDRNYLIKYCYSRSIRVYIMPKIPDVIIMNSDKMHLFDTPMLLTREYALRFEQRVIKRCLDIALSLFGIIVTSPIMLLTAFIIKVSDGGPVFYKQVRCTINNREFKIIKFRSMRVDAESDGKARLASKNDSRITPFGKFIRKVRIDELPQLFNILKGDMSFIGPRPERPEIIAQYMEEMPEFAFRTRVKAGLAGYAQVYGKYNTTPYDKLKLDLTYIEGYSLWLDIKLMLLTLKVLLSPEATEGVNENQTTALKGKDNGNEDSVQ